MKAPIQSSAILITIIPALLLLLAGNGCRTVPTGAEAVASYNASPLTVLIPSGVSPSTVDQLAAVTFSNRGWSITDQRAGSVTGHLNHRGIDATVTMKQENNTVRILVDSARQTRADGTSKPVVPQGWLENLRKDMNTRLVRSM